MRAVTGWRLDRTGVLVSVHAGVIERIATHRQISQGDPEAGGLLIGTRRGRHIQISDITEPQASDARSRFLFLRNTAGHAEAATRLWRSSNQQMDYLGEWHTHPQRTPTPSRLDLDEWLRICSERDDAQPMVFLIAGIESFYGAMVADRRAEALSAIESLELA